MRPEDRVRALLWDMRQAAREANALCGAMPFEAVASDRRTLLAVERLMEIVGECARRVPESFRAENPAIPWRAIIGMRNVLAHEYGTIDHRRLYRAATVDGVALCHAIEALLDAE